MEAGVALAAAAAAVAACVNAAVPSPYMDEVFHVPAAQRVCRGDWATRDPLITTPPGAYWLAAGLSAALGGVPCTVAALRAVNAGLLLVAYGAAAFALATRGAAHASAHALAIVTHPVTLFFAFLFYTDVGALAAVLATHVAAHQRPGLRQRAAVLLAGAASICMRQTSVVWVGFSVASAALARMDVSDGVAGWPLVLRACRQLACASVPVLPLAAAFLAFVACNGGSLVLGDASHHVPTLHGAQLCYLFAVLGCYTAVDAAAGLLDAARRRPLGKAHAQWLALLRTLFCARPAALRGDGAAVSGGAGASAPRRLRWAPAAAAAGASLALAALLHRFPSAHPFLLADNRHVTFYVWARLLSKPWLRAALAPAYVGCALLVLSRLAASVAAEQPVARARCDASPPAPVAAPPAAAPAAAANEAAAGGAGAPGARLVVALLWCAAWLACSAAVLVPSPLLEPRYFMVPASLALLHMRHDSSRTPRLWVAGNVAVGAGVLWLFLRRPFRWPDGSEARFMW